MSPAGMKGNFDSCYKAWSPTQGGHWASSSAWGPSYAAKLGTRGPELILELPLMGEGENREAEALPSWPSKPSTCRSAPGQPGTSTAF